MKYLYKQTGVIVESDRALDSALFAPYKETKEKPQPEEKEPAKPKGKAATAKKR